MAIWRQKNKTKHDWMDLVVTLIIQQIWGVAGCSFRNPQTSQDDVMILMKTISQQMETITFLQTLTIV